VSSYRRAGYLLLLGLVLLSADHPPGHGVEELVLTLGNIEGTGWSIASVQARLAWLDDHTAALRLEAAKALLPAPLGSVTDLNGVCPRLTISPFRITCQQGELRLGPGYLGVQRLQLDFDYRVDTGQLELAVNNLGLDGGRVAASMTRDRAGWNLVVRGNALQLARVSARLAAAGALTAPLSGPGTLGFNARLQGTGAVWQAGHLSVRVQSTEFSDPQGLLAGAKLGLGLDVDMQRVADRWHVTGSIEGSQGQLYIDPVFIDLDSWPVHATAQLDWQPASGDLRVHAFDYQHRDTVRLVAAGLVNLAGPVHVKEVSLDITEGRLPGLYDSYLQPWLNDTVLADLKMTGAITAAVRWRQGGLAGIHLDLDGVSVDDREGRFGLGGLQGRVDWAAGEAPRHSDLQWRDGHLYRVPLSSGQIAAESSDSMLRLREPARLGMLDGELQIDDFELAFPVDAPWSWRIDGILTPVSLPRLCQALGWPEFAGKLSGVIPDVRYTNGRLEVGGMLLVRAFDGDITLANLQLLQPLSTIPQLRVDARVDNIDLEALTGAFSFGRIEGRLDGRVDGLYMEAWRPVAFDASFATPAGDTSRHRISQKAVDNISSIGGGGVGGVLSRSMLRVFEDFPYDKLGISCRLENGTCEMGGVAPAANGYYIVKGRRLPPRLDVIGYAERVNWRSLVAQLVAVTRRQGGADAQ
jgi:hypothetical protein